MKLNCIFNWIGVLFVLSLFSACEKDDVADETVADADGNIYTTVTIGTQVWMVENLKTTKYNDGTDIPNITDGSEWSNLTTSGYCWYDNDIANKANFGALYNWYTVNTGKLAPVGWHVPTDDEWTTLTDYLGGESIAGGKLKETGYTHWYEPNEGATNESGFAALPGGSRNSDGTFFNIGSNSYWWSSSAGYTSNYSHYRRLGYYCSYVVRGGNYEDYGYSVRCLRD